MVTSDEELLVFRLHLSAAARAYRSATPALYTPVVFRECTTQRFFRHGVFFVFAVFRMNINPECGCNASRDVRNTWSK